MLFAMQAKRHMEHVHISYFAILMVTVNANLWLQKPCRGVTLKKLPVLRSAETLETELNTDIQRIIFLCDSAIVLKWLKKSRSCFHNFVGNRIVEIDDTLTRLWERLDEEQVSFSYTSHLFESPSPPDYATWVLRLLQLKADSRWQMGPSFFHIDGDKWPEKRIEPVSEQKEECKLGWFTPE